MRLVMILSLYIGFNLLYLSHPTALSSLTSLEVLLTSAIMAICTLVEALWALQRGISKPVVGKGAVLIKQGTPVAAEIAMPAPNVGVVENERDELRTRNAALLLRQKEMEEVAAALKRKLAESEKKQHLVTDEAAVGRRAVMNFVSTLQEKGRLIDFFMDDITPYADQQVGAAARVVHQGCGAALREQLQIKPVHQAAEGSSVTLEPGYETREWRLVGKVTGQPPYRGALLHRGWKVERFNLARCVASEGDKVVIAPAELEIG